MQPHGMRLTGRTIFVRREKRVEGEVLAMAAALAKQQLIKSLARLDLEQANFLVEMFVAVETLGANGVIVQQRRGSRLPKRAFACIHGKQRTQVCP